MADIILKEIENGVSITTPNGHEYIYTVYPWRVDKINPADLGKTALRNQQYGDITFNKECGTLRRTNANVAMLNIAKLLADVERFMHHDYVDDEEHKKKIILAMELAYKKGIASFGLSCELSKGDEILLRNLKCVPTKNISQAIAKKEKYNDLAQFLQEAIMLSLKDKLPPTILKHILTRGDGSILFQQEKFDMLMKYQKEIEHMLTTQDKKVQDIQNTIHNIINSIPNYIKDWLYNAPARSLIIDDKYNKTCELISITDILDKLSIVDRTCTEMAISNADYIKNKSYSEFIIGVKKLGEIYQDYKEQHKMELFKKRQQKLPQYNKIIDNHKIELVIPYTYQECQKIGEDFHNCFAEYEWSSYLSRGERYGCALYKDNKPYICLDVDVECNAIRQYLYTWNTHIDRKDEIAKIVKNELQDLFDNIK